MATHTVNIDVIDKTIPIGNNRVIPVINQPNPALGYAASANEVAQLLRLANYYVYEAGTDTIINPYNYYDYFPEAGGGGGGGGGGGVTPQTVQSMIDASIDSTVSDTSTKAVQNAAITNFVNSSIESSTADFKGTYDSKAEMDEVTANQNDYAFLCVLNDDGSVNHYERYKWSDTEVSGSHWLFEYNVNNSSFTAEQWAAINSGVKDTDVSALGGHVNNTNNPHSVTKAQVGLSDVDNTSDADKPISTATQAALNTKFDTAGTGLNKNGTTVSHATPEGAATHVKAFYKFSTDALGHVNGVTEATEAEVDAIDSGITAEKVGQIETNKNNILSVKDHYKYYNRTLFEQESIPTGTIAYGSTWIDGKAVRTYNQTTNIVGGVIEQGSWNTANIVKIDSTTRCRLSNSITVKPSTAYTIRLVSPTINNARLLLQYRDSNDYTSSESGWQTALPYTFTTPSNCHKATIILSTVGDLICAPTNFGNLQINEGNTALSYEVPSWSSTDSEIITPALKECVDNGAKNEFYFERVENGNNGSYSLNGDIITVTGTAPWAQARCYFNVRESGNYTISVKVTSLTTQKGAINIQDVTTSTAVSGGISISATGTYTLNATLDSTHDYWLTLMVNNTASTISSSNIVFTDIMLCKSELYKVSPTFEPHAMSNVELTALEKENEANILSVADQSTQYNLINLHNPIAVRNVVPTYLSDGGVTLDVNDAKWTAFNISFPAIVGVKYKFVVRITATTGFSVFNVFIRDTDGEGTNVTEYPTGISNAMINSVGTHVFEFTATATTMWIGFYPNNSSTAVTGSVTMKAQIIEKSLYDAGFTDYQPYALPNTTITPVLKECVDNGVKNLLSYTLADIKSYNSNGVSWNGNVCTVGNLIFTINSDMSVTVSGSQGTGSAYLVLAKNVSYPAIRFQGCPAGGGSSTYQLQAYYSSAPTASANDNGTGVSVAANTWSEICITIRPNQTFSNPITFKPMAIPQSLYDAGFTDYQPYAMSNADLTPHTTNVVKNNFTATDWTKVDELAFEIPTGKIAEFSASATRDTNILVKGIAFVNDDTFSIDRVLAISENANEKYYALAVHGIRSRKNFTSETVNVFVKYSAAPVSSSITCTYRFV